MDQNQSLRTPDMKNYPALCDYEKHRLYDGFIGCGGLFLLDNMIEQMNIKTDDIILDLGCGLGGAAAYLAKKFNITVIAVDLWHSSENLKDKLTNINLLGTVSFFQLDITKNIPFDNNYFDVIFSMNALFIFGEKVGFLSRLLEKLKPGGIFCLGSECFRKEPDVEMAKAFDFEWKWDVWNECFSKYHFPEWWEKLLNETSQLKIDVCRELDDGEVLWEDMAQNYSPYFDNIIGSDAMIPQNKIFDLIECGKKRKIYLTLFVLRGIRIDEMVEVE